MVSKYELKCAHCGYKVRNIRAKYITDYIITNRGEINIVTYRNHNNHCPFCGRSISHRKGRVYRNISSSCCVENWSADDEEIII